MNPDRTSVPPASASGGPKPVRRSWPFRSVQSDDAATAGRGRDAQVPGTRKRLHLAVLVGVLASIAGAGVAVASRDDGAEQSRRARLGNAIIRGISPRVLEFTFNPSTSRGLKMAKVAFRFTYRHRMEDQARVRTRIDQQWNIVHSHCLRVLMRFTPQELKSDEGLDRLTGELRRAIDLAVFTDGIGTVEDVHYQQVIVQ